MPSARDLAFVGCRLLALLFLYWGLLSIPHGLFALSSAFGSGGPQGWARLYEPALWLSFASPILSLAMVLLLWFGAGWLSREVAEGAPLETSEWSSQSLLSTMVVLLGLVLVSLALPQFVLHLLFITDDAAKAQPFQVHYLISEVVQALVGIGLILGSGRIPGAIARLRRWSAVSEK